MRRDRKRIGTRPADRETHEPRIEERQAIAPRIARVLVLIGLIWIGLSYRLYLARYLTEAGIPSMAGWWGYIVDNARLLSEGGQLKDSLYAPGQTIVAYGMAEIWRLDPGVLRVGFGFLDGIAILFLFLLAKELTGWSGGLLAAALYALWPEGSSASVNILHDHSPQPLFLFSGIWLVVLWMRRGKPLALLIAGGVLLGMPPLFRTDGVMVALLASVALACLFAVRRKSLRAVALYPAVLLASSLLPSIPYDFVLLARTGQWTHIAAGDWGSAVFIRYGRNTNLAGTRYHDSEVAFISGVGEPFGKRWEDARRLDILARFGKRLLRADVGRYARIVREDSLGHLFRPAGHQLWLPSEIVRLGDLRMTPRLQNPEFPAAILTAMTGLQELLVDRKLMFLLATLGAIAGFFYPAGRPVVVATVLFGWVFALLILVPDSRYMIMALCLTFVLVPVALGGILRLGGRIVKYSGRIPFCGSWQG